MDYTARTGSDGQPSSGFIQLGQVVMANRHQDYTARTGSDGQHSWIIQLGQVAMDSSHGLYS
jgi:hypothetical protein